MTSLTSTIRALGLCALLASASLSTAAAQPNVRIDDSALDSVLLNPKDREASERIAEIKGLLANMASRCLREGANADGKSAPFFKAKLTVLATTPKVVSMMLEKENSCGDDEPLKDVRAVSFDRQTGDIVDLGHAYSFGFFEEGLWQLRENGQKLVADAFQAKDPALFASCKGENSEPYESKPYSLGVQADGSPVIAFINPQDRPECWRPIVIPAAAAAPYLRADKKTLWQLP